MNQRYSVVLVLIMFLAGCAPQLWVQPVGGTIPEWVVLLTGRWPNDRGRCAGSALSPHLVLTANHCLEQTQPTLRIVTQRGGEFDHGVTALKTWPEDDLAILHSELPLGLRSYATVALPKYTQPALMYGACPHYAVTTPRVVYYIQDESITSWDLPDSVFKTERWKVGDDPGTAGAACGGDSGGPLVQDGRLVGIAHALLVRFVFMPIGDNVFYIPATDIIEAVQDLIEIYGPLPPPEF